MGEAALARQVVPDGLAPPNALGDGPAGAVENQLAIDDFVLHPQAGFDGQHPQFVGILGVVVPPLGAGVDVVDERGAADGQGAADFVVQVQPVGRAGSGDVAAIGVAGRQHRGGVLLPAAVHYAVHLARRAESAVGAPRRAARHLNVGVGVGFVVVAQNQQVVFVVLQGGGNGREAHIHAAAVAAEGDDVDGIAVHLAFAHHRGQAGGGAGGGAAGRAELGVHPRHHPGSAVVGGVGDIHTAGAAQHDAARAGGLNHQPHGQRRLAALAGAVAGAVELLHRDILDAPNRGQFLHGRRHGVTPSPLSRWFPALSYQFAPLFR